MYEKLQMGLAALAMCCVSGLSMGADFDGSKALVCASIEAHDCLAGDTCPPVAPTMVGVPQFMRIDFTNKTVAGPFHTTPIQLLAKTEEELLLQGNELGYAWTVTIDAQTGSMTGSLVGRHEVVAVFGACTPL